MNNDKTPNLGEIMEGARSTREMFLAYTEAGFTEQQAMQIICAIMQEMFSSAMRKD